MPGHTLARNGSLVAVAARTNEALLLVLLNRQSSEVIIEEVALLIFCDTGVIVMKVAVVVVRLLNVSALGADRAVLALFHEGREGEQCLFEKERKKKKSHYIFLGTPLWPGLRPRVTVLNCPCT